MLRDSKVTCHTGTPYSIFFSNARRYLTLCTAEVSACAACRASLAFAVAEVLGHELRHVLWHEPSLDTDPDARELQLEMRRLAALACLQHEADWSVYRQGTTLDDLVVVDSVSPAREAVAA